MRVGMFEQKETNEEDELLSRTGSKSYGGLDSEASLCLEEGHRRPGAFSTRSSLSPSRPISLAWKNVNVFAKDQKDFLQKLVAGVICRRSAEELVDLKQILFECCGVVKDGELLGVMGTG